MRDTNFKSKIMENFIEELKWSFIDSFTSGDGLEIAWAILMLVLCLALLALAFYGIFYLIDAVGLPTQKDLGLITDMKYKKEHTTYTTIINGKTIQVVPIHHPDSWTVTIDYKNEKDTINVSKEKYLKLECNTKVVIEYVRGRISNSFYLKAIGG